MAKLISNLKKYRLLNNLTQEELAEKVKVRRETIIHLEAGRYNPSLKLALNLAKVLNVKVEDLFSFEEED
ncbi:MAG TPA: helix-turn-helix transcriptional regulator [Clostridia bacterium]|nr:helix-turn-helix transcriptional regulator [Clostridia bacterium]